MELKVSRSTASTGVMGVVKGIHYMELKVIDMLIKLGFEWGNPNPLHGVESCTLGTWLCNRWGRIHYMELKGVTLKSMTSYKFAIRIHYMELKGFYHGNMSGFTLV